MILLGIYLFLLALLFALVEIEIEGRYGWAERLPTWYRKTGPSRVFSLCNSGKPLTGYHLFMNLFMLAAFHFPFAVGLPWSVAVFLGWLETIGVVLLSTFFAPLYARWYKRLRQKDERKRAGIFR